MVSNENYESYVNEGRITLLPKAEMQELEEAANNIGSEVIIIGNENQEGEQFWNLTKGVGAILRFALE